MQSYFIKKKMLCNHLIIIIYTLSQLGWGQLHIIKDWFHILMIHDLAETKWQIFTSDALPVAAFLLLQEEAVNELKL